MTLWQVLNGKYPPHHIQHHLGSEEEDDNNKPLRPISSLPPRTREAVLKSSFDNAVNGSAEDPDGASSGIDMVYHSRFFVDNKVENGDGDGGNNGRNNDSHDGSNSDGDGDDDEDDGNNNNTQRSNAHGTLQTILDTEKLPIASIVYLTIQGILIYDRHRGGLVLSPEEERFLLFGDAILDDDVDVVDSNAIDESYEGHRRHLPHDNNEPMHVHEQMTHHLLDEIFSYADDGGPAVLSRVCKSWRDEVGTRSPQLWNMLLGRRDWPETVDGRSDDECDALEECRRGKAAFVSHYTAVRDVRALKDACSSMAGGGGSSSSTSARGNSDERKDAKLEEFALQIFKSTKGAPAIPKNTRCTPIVRIWYDPYEATASTRALVAYEDFTLRLFEVDRSSSSNNSGSKSSQGSSSRSTAVVGAGAKIRCRQVVCVRAAPTSISGKKDDCTLTSMELNNETVACFVMVLEQHGGSSIGSDVESTTIPWMTVFSREDVVCAGNEGLLDDASVQSFNLREEVVQFLGRDSDDDDALIEELPGGLHTEILGLHDYLAAHDGNTSDVEIKVTPKLVACGKGHFLFHAFLRIPEFSELQPNNKNGEDLSDLEDPIWVPESRGHRLFLFSAKDGRIVTSLPLESYREGTSLFASRPFKCSATSDITNNAAAPSLCTNVLISGPTMELLLTRVEIRRHGSKTLGPLQKLLTREHPQQGLSPWSRMDAVLTSSHAIFSTDPIQGPELHFQRLQTHRDRSSMGGNHSIGLGGRDCKLRNMFLLREHYVAVVIGTCSLDDELEEEDELFDGHWFGHDETSLEMIVYHIPTCREIYRTSVSSDALSAYCIGDTLAANVSRLGFVITGGNARDVARTVASEEENTYNSRIIGSPGGKTPKVKKKRLASGASGRKKDGFARGMSHGG